MSRPEQTHARKRTPSTQANPPCLDHCQARADARKETNATHPSQSPTCTQNHGLSVSLFGSPSSSCPDTHASPARPTHTSMHRLFCFCFFPPTETHTSLPLSLSLAPPPPPPSSSSTVKQPHNRRTHRPSPPPKHTQTHTETQTTRTVSLPTLPYHLARLSQPRHNQGGHRPLALLPGLRGGEGGQKALPFGLDRLCVRNCVWCGVV